MLSFVRWNGPGGQLGHMQYSVANGKYISSIIYYELQTIDEQNGKKI